VRTLRDAVGTSCRFSVDGSPIGTGSTARTSVTPGKHTVTCRPAGGASSGSRSVEVGAGKAKTALFKF
jgi:hypothetical protein